MKKAFVLISSVLIIFLANTGCQKEVPASILGDTTNTTTTAILRRIRVHSPSATDPLDTFLSLQYDTAGRKINVYLDDTTTSNPYDLLAIDYQFDANGYLVSSNSIEYNGTLQPDFVITRNGSGQIQKIIEYNAEEIGGIPYNDTVYYSYEQSGGKTIIKDSVRYHDQTIFSSRKTEYDAQNNPVAEHGYYSPHYLMFKNYNYSNGMISTIISNVDTSYLPNNDTTFITYDNTPVANQWQSLPQLFLGKDYYILQQDQLTFRLSYTFLSFIMEHDFETVYNPLLTKPLSKIVVRGYPYSNPNNFLVKTINFTYTYTAEKLPATISVLPEGYDPIYYTFEYK